MYKTVKNMICKKKKVLFVITYLNAGGAERALSNIVTHFPEDWDIDLLLNSKDNIAYPYKGNIISLDIAEPKNRVSLFFQGHMLIKRLWILRGLKKSGKYRACISFMDSANIANILTGNKYCKTLISVRVNLSASRHKMKYKCIVAPLAKLFYNHADKVVAVSKGVESDLKEAFHVRQERLTAIVNGYDTRKILALSREKIQLNAANLVISVGRLTEPKGQWHLIRAFSEVIKYVPDAHLLIFGEGYLEEYLKKLVKDLELENYIEFKGFVNNPFKYIGQAKLFVLPSMYEGFPNALAEAICCGIPCVATDFPSGAREILAPSMPPDEAGTISNTTFAEYGVLLPLCSGKQYTKHEALEWQEIEMANAILQILQHNEIEQHYKEQSAARSKELDIETIVKQWIDIIEE